MKDNNEISPADIRHKEFSGSMFGYNKAEVRDFLESMADHFQDLYTQRILDQSDNAQQVNVYEDRAQTQIALEQIQKREELIAKTLIQAENTRSEIIRTAKIEADNIIKHAELSARKAIDETISYLNLLKHEYITLKETRRQFVSSAHAQLRVALERLEADPMFAREKEQDLDKKFDEARKISINSKEVKPDDQ
jgi:DivIVA domain-containing protein